MIPASDSADPAADEQGDYTVVRGDTLWDIADEQLDDPTRYPEIVQASDGITQPDGRQLTDPDLILPGWTLNIPDQDPTTATAPPTPSPQPRPRPRPKLRPARSLDPPQPGTPHRVSRSSPRPPRCNPRTPQVSRTPPPRPRGANHRRPRWPPPRRPHHHRWARAGRRRGPGPGRRPAAGHPDERPRGPVA